MAKINTLVYIHFVAISLLITTAFTGCKPRSSELSTSKSKSTECKYSVPSPQTLQLQSAVSQMFDQYLRQEISLQETQARLQSNFDTLAAGDQNSQTLALTSSLIVAKTQEIEMAAVFKLATGTTLSKDERLKLHLSGFTMDDVANKSADVKHLAQCLKQSGVKLSAAGQWDLAAAKISYDELSKNACLLGGITYFISSQPLTQVVSQRSEAIRLGNFVVPACTNKAVTSQDQWNSFVELHLNGINREIADYLRASGELGTYSAIIKGRAFERPWLPGVKSLGELISGGGPDLGNANEITRDGAYQSILKHRDALNCLGVPQQLKSAINDILFAMIEIDNQNIQTALSNLSRAQFTAITTPLMLVGVGVLPTVGRIVGTLAAGAATVATKLAITGLSISAGITVIGAVAKSTTDWSFSGGDLLCELGENLAMGGASFLNTAPLILALPYVTTAGGVIAGVKLLGGAEAGALQGIIYAQQIAAIGFTLNQVKNLPAKFKACSNQLQQTALASSNIQSETDAQLVSAYAGAAVKACTEAGLDVAYLGAQAKAMAQSYNAIKDIKAAVGSMDGKYKNIEDVKAEIKEHFKDGDPEYWVKYAETHQGKRLGGMAQGAYLVDGPNGKKMVLKTFEMTSDNLGYVMRNLQKMKEWASDGSGLGIAGIGVRQSGANVKFTIATEFYFDKTTTVGNLIAGGDGHAFAKVVQEGHLTKAGAEKISKVMMKLLDSHDDPHLGNILVRVVETKGPVPTAKPNQVIDGNKIIEVALIDPDRFMQTHAQLRKWFRDNPIPNKLIGNFFTRSWQEKFLGEAIQLAN